MAPLWILLTLLPILGGAQRFNCKGRILGAYYADAKSGCKAFHVCVRVAGGGIRDFRFFCPPGTLFHQEAQTCTDWGDDDPLACPADIYDGQFDLYKIGSVYDTKKLPTGNREDESEFGLQRAETGDRRLAQNNQNNANNAGNDLRAAHSSDFFSGQRDRGRDETAPSGPTAAPARSAQPRQSFRRATTPRATPPATQYTTPPPPPPPPQPTNPSQYETSKRKLVRKRPVYLSTPAPTFPPNNAPQQSYKEQTQQSYKEQTQQPFKQQPQQPYKEQTQLPYKQQTQLPYKQQQQQPYKEQTQQPFKGQPQQSYKDQPFKSDQLFKQQQQQQQQNQPQNFNRRFPPQNRPNPTTTPDVPLQYREYKDEYVEVSRVTPKPNRYYPSNPTPLPSSYSTSAVSQYNKKDGLAELYNYEAQSTPGLNVQHNDNNEPFKVKNSFSVADVPREDFARTRPQNNNFNNGVKQHFTTTVDYNKATGTAPTTQSYKNYNSVSYEPEKNNFIPFSKQNYYNPTTTAPATTTYYTTVRPEPPQNLNTVAYNTNIGFHSQSNFANPDEDDDGQYRPPQGEDDGQYRPELYGREQELLSGAHSLNIAASGNRLPEDQQKKTYSKTQSPPKFTSQTAAPRPFRPAPTPTSQPRQTTSASEPSYTTTFVPQTQRTFDLFQTYTTTSRPTDFPVGAPDFVPINNGPVRLTTTVAPRAPETRPPRPQTRPAQAPTFPPAPAPRPTTRAPHAAKPISNKEDASYDYAYYDSDPGFTEYDHIEEFGRTKKRA